MQHFPLRLVVYSVFLPSESAMDIDGAGGALGRRFGYGSAVLLDRLEKLPEAIRSDEKREWCVCVTLYGFKAYGVKYV